MAMTKTEIVNLIKKLGFTKEDGVVNIYSKKYNMHNDYQIRINFDDKRIFYSSNNSNNNENSIRVLGNFSTNFDKDENFVVLECINRLLECGYKPSSIEIEKSWPSGHNKSDRLDILVRKLNHDPYIMIECKTWGNKYEKEKNNMLETRKIGNEEQPKGQLFSYYWEEKKTEYLVLYASRYNENKIEFVNSLIQVQEEWKNLSNKHEVFNYWNKTFRHSGLFEVGIMPYNIKSKALTRADLEKITNDSSNLIFYQFEEILRHNSISDKSNAFNKLLNLFICKIIDEDRNNDDELLFQWKENDSFITLQSALEDLYKIGMQRFLNIEVTDYSDKDIEYLLNSLDNENREKIKKIVQDLRFQKNPVFAFKEVFNKESFEDNAKVLKEVVELLQTYQFRYGHKQQFLGSFFELLLNSSIKQESGQFFTPVPIARFMVSALPLKDIIDENVRKDRDLLLPVMVDYACGAGHFLTEYMDVLQDIINAYDVTGKKNRIKNSFLRWKQTADSNYPSGEFEWAKDYVYGIEKDYMLVKTTKISTFLNGDGDANIIHADGLDNFNSQKYIGALKSTNKFNYNFDVIIANPPYSVNSFKQTLPCSQDLFEVYKDLTENSSEIELLFIQRTRDLLKENGIASLVLPTSILNNNGTIYEKTRKILIENFKIKSIIEMGKNTFMETGTNTMIVFLQKRKQNEIDKAELYSRKFINERKDFTYNGIENVIQNYLEDTFDSITFDEYKSILEGNFSEEFKKSDYYIENERNVKKYKGYKNITKSREFRKLSEDEKRDKLAKVFTTYINEIETLHIKYYLLSINEKTILANTGEKDEEKQFIGYENSKRRGYEGIHTYKDADGHIDSGLFDETVQHTNPEKLDYYIYKNYKNEELEIPDSLSERAKVFNTYQLFDFYNLTLSTKLTLTPDFNIIINPQYDNHVRLDNIKFFDFQKGTTITEKDIVKGNVPVVAGGKEEAYYHNVSNRNANVVTISASGSAGYVNYWDVPIFASDCYTIISKNEQILLTKFIYCCLKSHQDDIYKLQRGQNPVHVYPEQLNRIKIPLMSFDKQKELSCKYFMCLNKIKENNEKIKSIVAKENEIISTIDKSKCKQVPLGDEKYVNLKRGPFGGDLKKEIFVSSGYKVYEQKNAIQNNITLGRYYITQEKFNEMIAFEVKPNDILMSCSGTIGKFIIVPNEAEQGIINQALLRIRATDKIIPTYLKLCLVDLTNTFIKNSHGTGIENISSIDILKNFKIFVPDKPIQNKAVDLYNDYENQINILKKENIEYEKEMSALFD
jgi:type I restriction enzyme M protein